MHIWIYRHTMKKNAEQKNKHLGKSINSKLKPAMYEIAIVLKKKEFKSIDQAAQKSITDLKKKLTLYEKKAENAAQTGEDIDCTIEQVSEKVKEAIIKETLP